MTTYLTLDQFVERAGISYRTALRRLHAKEIRGAEKRGSQWAIPVEALAAEPAAELAQWEHPDDMVPQQAEQEQLSLVDVQHILSQLPGMLTVAQAEYVIGARLHDYPERLSELDGRKWGHQGAWLVPQSAIRRILGI